MFIFNPNYKRETDSLRLDRSLGFSGKTQFTIRELYPDNGRLWGKPGAGNWSLNDAVPLDMDGTSATVLEIAPARAGSPAVYNASTRDARATAVKQQGGTLFLSGVAGEPGTDCTLGVLATDSRPVQRLIVNNHPMPFRQTGKFISAKVHFAGYPFRAAQEVAIKRADDGALEGSFLVPERIFRQLAARQRAWPIPWTEDDLKTTWLAPQRLLLVIQTVDPSAGLHAVAELDGRPLPLIPAFSSVREHLGSATGFYADLSGVAPDVEHHLRIRPSGAASEKITGIFFDNVRPDYTLQVLPQVQP